MLQCTRSGHKAIQQTRDFSDKSLAQILENACEKVVPNAKYHNKFQVTQPHHAVCLMPHCIVGQS